MEGRWVLYFIGFYILLGSFIGTHSAHDYDHAANLRFFSECESKKAIKTFWGICFVPLILS